MSLFSSPCSVLSVLRIDLEKEKLIHVKEGELSDANFIISYVIKEILSKPETSICMVNLHNMIQHYNGISLRLKYNITDNIQCDRIAHVNILQNAHRIIFGQVDPVPYLQEIKSLIFTETGKLLEKYNGNCYIIIDDLSHFLDLGIPYSEMIRFVNFCASLAENDRVHIVLGNHVTEENLSKDTMLGNILTYACDLDVSVSALKTGNCPGVTGIVNVQRRDEPKEIYHFNVSDRGVKVFNPGASLEALKI